MSLGCRTPGRRNSWVIQIPLSLSTPPPILPCFASSPFWRLTRGGSPLLSLHPHPPPVSLRPRRGAESYPRATRCTAHSSKAADPLHWGTACYGLMNSVFGAGRAVRVTSLYTAGVGSGGIGGAGGGVFTYYEPSWHIKHTQFGYRGASPSRYGFPLGRSRQITSCFVLKGSRQHARFDNFLLPHQGHSANTWWTAPGFSFPPWIFLLPHIICKLMCGN